MGQRGIRGFSSRTRGCRASSLDRHAPPEDRADGLGDVLARVLGLADGDGDDFGTWQKGKAGASSGRAHASPVRRAEKDAPMNEKAA